MVVEMEVVQREVKTILDNVEKVIIGKRDVIELAIIALLSKGHLLIEDAPGVGKTMLARSLAKSIGCSFKRIQFTPDMLPSDIIGVTVYNQKTGDFEYRPGPIMAQIVLADEINRATPKVQSALLECMEEGQTTVDGIVHRMPPPFHILATENPIEYEGTFPLPETQLDRFLMRINLGYPSTTDEIAIINSQRKFHPIDNLSSIINNADYLELQDAVTDIYVDDLIKQYIVSLTNATRHNPSIILGVSPRGSLALYRAAQARALVHNRDYVLPDDIKILAEPVLAHRIIVRSNNYSQERSGKEIIAQILDTISVPGSSPADA
jgi:MoxR-like ATPase